MNDDSEPFTVVFVNWRDSYGGSGQFSKEEAGKKTVDLMYTAGLLISEDEEKIVLAQDLFRVNTENPQVRQYIGILKINIIKTERWVAKQTP